jgi:hypothetical protein
LRDEDQTLCRLSAAEDAEELCRLLLAGHGGWRSHAGHMEAIDLLGKACATDDIPASFVALMLCSCRRWDRVTSSLIAAVEESGLLHDDELDELAESLIAHELVIEYPPTWVSPQWLEVQLDDGAGRTYTVNEDTPAQHRPTFEPPLRRWAARRLLQADQARLDDLLTGAELFEPRHRDAVIHGLLDAADQLDSAERRRLIKRGLQTASASVRRTGLKRLCELDGPAPALRRARSDTNAAVRK